MGFGFRKSIKIAPGVRLNVGSKSIGMSAGVKGFRYSVNSRTGRRVTASIPGTGLSYTSSSKGSSRSSAYQKRNEILRRQKELEKVQEIERAKWEVEAYQNTIDRIHSIHIEADDVIDWHGIADQMVPVGIGQNEKKAMENRQMFKASFFEKLFKKVERKEAELDRLIEIARQEDEKSRQRIISMKQTAKYILAGDEDVYIQVFEEMQPFDDLLEFGSQFEIVIVSPTVIEVEFEVNGKEVVPKEEKMLTKTGKLSIKPLTKTKYYDILQDYVCSTAIRVARDSLALLPIQEVYVHAYDTVSNSVTGHTERICILSVCFDQVTLDSLNMDAIDCSDSMNNFAHKMDFKKTKGFVAVEPLIIK
ncbi:MULTISPECIES: DUF4236 domain-containing protein [unclassified Bacillus (in: firmicutes)]|uniref:DUF4236 domain-containing protein n=1 Tax=unclassified Bacillus (in: firmicutes) TaxID=185979 RepID=UPI0008E3BEB7|nr:MULTISPECIES: DUF4236 domain-containing protein [unclassified Bacillus (in: firmicutes)]PGZ93952.1 DUF4236 domain-containing protein [Bacillus sp. AFS029533]SFD76278.1 Protein of unknown function [Bacillus sp. UNCCL81]